MVNLLIFGPPGAGKGTQAKLIAKAFTLKHISTGDIFRQHIKENTDLGKEVQEIMNQGHLVPDNLTIKILKNAITDLKSYNGLLLDGFPRTLAQAKALSKITSINKVINLVLDDEEAIKRQTGRRTCPKCNKAYNINVPALKPKYDETCDYDGEKLQERPDGKFEIVKERLKVYHQQSQPVLDFYKEQDIVLNIDARPNIEEIFENIKNSLKT